MLLNFMVKMLNFIVYVVYHSERKEGREERGRKEGRERKKIKEKEEIKKKKK